MAEEDSGLDGPLPAWSRVLVGLTGLGLLVAGVLSVFVKDASVAGVPVLLVLGVALLYVGLSGQRLLQVNKDGVVLGRAARRLIAQVVADPEVPESVKARLIESAEDSGLRVSVNSARFFEAMVRGVFATIGRENGFEVRRAESGSGADLILANLHGRHIPVEIKSRPSLHVLRRSVHLLERLDDQQRILVTDVPVPPDMARDAQERGVWIFEYAPGAEDKWTSTLRSLEFLTSAPFGA